MVALALLMTACGLDRFEFTNDDRLSFHEPTPRSLVTLPVAVRWSMKDFDPVGLNGSSDDGSGAFVVFVDRAPMPVGRNLKWVMRNVDGCDIDARCPTREQLAERHVYVTTKPEITLQRLARLGRGSDEEHHYINVVLVDGSGERTRESAWYLPFRTERTN